jgi:hypothetical protein
MFLYKNLRRIPFLVYFCPVKESRMKLNKSLILALTLLILIGSVCRIAGFAPQIAMAIFGGAVIKDRRLAFILPLGSMFLSDLLYEVLFRFGYAPYGGIYEGQLTNYILLASIVIIGFIARNLSIQRIIVATLAGPTLYFLLSNFLLWLNGGGYQRPKTWSGLIMCYTDAVPFFRSGLINTLIFSAILFGGYFLLQRNLSTKKQLN